MTFERPPTGATSSGSELRLPGIGVGLRKETLTRRGRSQDTGEFATHRRDAGEYQDDRRQLSQVRTSKGPRNPPSLPSAEPAPLVKAATHGTTYHARSRLHPTNRVSLGPTVGPFWAGHARIAGSLRGVPSVPHLTAPSHATSPSAAARWSPTRTSASFTVGLPRRSTRRSGSYISRRYTCDTIDDNIF